jgi:hypothetical protein
MKNVILRRLAKAAFAAALLLVILMGPAATCLQSRGEWADPNAAWDAVYLVAGARAQDRRIAALTDWLAATPEPASAGRMRVLIGNDSQVGHWCREHQTNHTRAEWAIEKLEEAPAATSRASGPEVVPGAFSSTDGEMQALRDYLAAHPGIKRVALATCRFHARRILAGAGRHCASADRVFGVIPGPAYWENRAPWIVLGEYAKLLRDTLGLSLASGLTRRATQAPPSPDG